MDKYIYFIKNLSALAVGQFSSKLILFFMVPVYTSYLSSSDYGIYDFVNTIISLSVPIFIANIHTSILRFVIDTKFDNSKVFQSAWLINIFGICMFLCMIVINHIVGFSDIISKYGIETVLLFSATTTYFIISEYMRGKEKIKDISIAGVINTTSVVTLNVFFLTVINWGLKGFFLSSILGLLFACIYLILKIESVKIFALKYNASYVKEMLSFSFPMIFNSLSWWINGVAGRYIIIALVGVAANGIYAISYTIVSIFVVLQNVFDQAWVISSLKEFKSENRDVFYFNMYNFYNFFLINACFFLFVMLHKLSEFLFRGDFIQAWIYVPFLMVGALFGALSGFIGVIFSAVKKTKVFAKTTIVGAVVNLLLSYMLVTMYGALGASIAAVLSGCFVWLSRVYYARKYVNVNWLYYKNLLAYLILIVQGCCLINIPVSPYLYGTFAINFIIIALLYWKQYSVITGKIRSIL